MGPGASTARARSASLSASLSGRMSPQPTRGSRQSHRSGAASANRTRWTAGRGPCSANPRRSPAAPVTPTCPVVLASWPAQAFSAKLAGRPMPSSAETRSRGVSEPTVSQLARFLGRRCDPGTAAGLHPASPGPIRPGCEGTAARPREQPARPVRATVAGWPTEGAAVDERQ